MKLIFLQKSPIGTLLQAALLYAWLVNLQDTNSIYTVYVLIAVAALLTMKQDCPDESVFRKPCGIFAGVLAGFTVLANYNLFSPWTALLSLFNASLSFAGGWVAFYRILLFLACRIPFVSCDKERKHFVSVFWISFGVTALVYLAYLFFHSYPGLLNRDSMSTVKQILTGEYNNTMPFWHTVTVEPFFRLGYAMTGNINGAVATYMVVQTMFLAAVFAYGVVTLYQIGVPMVVLVPVYLGYTFLPFHVAYSVTLWKDVLFGAAALMLVTSLYRLLKGIGSVRLNEVIFILGAFGLSLWRTNGWYAMLVTVLAMLFICARTHKRIVTILVIVLLVAWVMINPLLDALNVPETNFVEAMCIPFQQIARVMVNHRDLTQEEHAMLSEVFRMELFEEKYEPGNADPIKFEVFKAYNKDYFKNHLLDYMSLWVKLGFKYPGDYLQAWVEITKGYWNGGYDYWIYMYHMDENTLGITQTLGNNPIASVFKAMSRYLEKAEILRPLYCIGLQVWMLMGCCFLCAVHKRKEWIITLPILVIVAGLWIGTPIYSEFRYAYPVFTTIPVIGCITLFGKNDMAK